MGVKGLNSLILNIYEKENIRRSNVNLIRADAIRKLKDEREKLNEQEINDLTLLVNEKELELLKVLLKVLPISNFLVAFSFLIYVLK